MTSTRFFAVASVCAIAIGLGGPVLAAEPPVPTSSDKCAVCGMFVSKYPNWVAVLVKTDGSRVFFDGPKDMFKYILDTGRYDSDPGEVSAVFVTDYYTTRPINAREAFFVSGSDVTGPMGPELVAIDNEAHARTFLEDHGGEAVLAFGEVRLENIPR